MRRPKKKEKKKVKLTKKLMALLLAAVLTLALAACAGGTPQPSPSSSGTPSVSDPGTTPDPSDPAQETGIQAGTVLNMAYATQMNVHLPYLNVQGSFLSMNIYDTLFYFKDGDPNQIAGLLAKDWVYDADNLGCTVTLNEDACFYTGDPITAQTCVDAWATTKEYMPSYFNNIESIEAKDEHTLYFKFAAHLPSFEVVFCDTITSVVDPKAIAAKGATSNEAAIGSGPYYIEKYVDGEVITLRANPNYWFPARQPHVETINIYYITDTNTQLIAIQSGDVDLLMTQDVETYYTLSEQKDLDLYSFDAQCLTVWINEESSPELANAKVCEALGHLIDWQAACDIVYDGLYTAAKGIWKEGTAGYVDNTKNWTHDPELGLKLLEEAGVKPSDIHMEMLCYPKYKDVFVAVQSQLAQYGITLDVPTTESSAVSSKHAAGDFSLASSWCSYTPANPLSGFTTGVTKTGAQRSVFLDKCAPEADAKLDELYAQAVSADSLSQQYELCREMTAILQDNFVNCGGIQLYHWLFLNNKFTNLVYQGNVFYVDFCYLRAAE